MKVDPQLGMRRIAGRACAAISVFLALAFAPSLGRTAEANQSGFRWSRAVKSAAIDQATLQAIRLDSPIFAATANSLIDMRLRNQQDQPVAFVIRQPSATKQRNVVKNWVAVERGAKPLAPSGLEIFIDPPEDQVGPLQGISVNTPLRNFEQQVRVFSSLDGNDWQPASPPSVIFDYSRFVDVRSVNVPIADTNHRHFRLVIDDVTTEEAAQLLELSRHFQGAEEVDRSTRTTIDRRPFRVDRITFYGNVIETEDSGVQNIVYPTTGFRIDQDAPHKQTLVEFKSEREPLSTLTLLTDETNFSRAASLQIPTAVQGKDEWRSVATATLSRFSFQALKKNELSMTFPEQRGNRYRVVVENRDSPPLSFNGVEVEGPEYQLVFLAVPGQQLTLDYDWPAAPAPSYDTAAIRASLAAKYSPALVQLDQPVENTMVPARPMRWSALLEDTRVVIGVVAGLIALLGWGLYRASRRIDIPPQA